MICDRTHSSSVLRVVLLEKKKPFVQYHPPLTYERREARFFLHEEATSGAGSEVACRALLGPFIMDSKESVCSHVFLSASLGHREGNGARRTQRRQ